MADPKVHSETIQFDVKVAGLERLAVPILVVEVSQPLTAEQVEWLHNAAVRSIESGVFVAMAPVTSIYWVTP